MSLFVWLVQQIIWCNICRHDYINEMFTKSAIFSMVIFFQTKMSGWRTGGFKLHTHFCFCFQKLNTDSCSSQSIQKRTLFTFAHAQKGGWGGGALKTLVGSINTHCFSKLTIYLHNQSVYRMHCKYMYMNGVSSANRKPASDSCSSFESNWNKLSYEPEW